AARTNARRDATGSEPACMAGTRRTLPGPQPRPFPRLVHTRGPVPAITPGAAFRLPGAPLTGALAATGRRRWRLPAGFGSPHGRTGGVLAWRESSRGGKTAPLWKT